MKTGRFIKALYILISMVPVSGFSMVIETSPADQPALPAGTDLAVVYYQHVERDALYANGNRVPQSVRLDSDVGLARWVHWTTLWGFTVTPQVIVPVGSLRLHAGDTALSSSGMGDPFVGSEIWFLNDPAAKRYLALGLYVSVPLGAYDANQGTLNVGSNRWVQVTHISYSQNLYGPVYLDLTGELALYGDNRHFAGATYRERPTVGLQTHLRYEINARSRVGLSYFHSAGGRTTLAGVEQSGANSVDSYRVSAAYMLTPTFQIEGEFGQDIRVTNGAKEARRFNLRLTKAF